MWSDPYFYILLSFALFVLLAGRPLYRKLKGQIQDHAQSVERNLKEVADLHREATLLLKEKKEAFVQMESTLKEMEAKTQQSIQDMETKTESEVASLKALYENKITQELQSLEKDATEALKQDLLERSLSNAQWLLEKKLTKEQHQEITSKLLEKL